MGTDPAESTVLVVLDQREDEAVGFDFVSLPEANRVAGMWNLAPGAHFLYVRAKDEGRRGTRLAEGRLGEFVYLRSGEIRVFRRSQEEDGALFAPVEEYSTAKYKESIVMGHLRDRMAKIPENLAELWAAITDCVNSELILRLRPITRVLRSQQAPAEPPQDSDPGPDPRNDADLRNATIRVDLGDAEDDPAKVLEEYKQVAGSLAGFRSKLDLSKLRGRRGNDGTPSNCQIDRSVEQDDAAIYYSDLPTYDRRINRFKAISPQAVTSMHMDMSYVIESVKDGYENDKYGYRGEEFENKYLYALGELQYSFVLFVLCFNFESFQQYKRLLRAFCNAEKLLVANEELARRFLRTLRYHVEIWDEDHDVYMADDFLTQALANLREIFVDSPDELGHCREGFERLEDSFKLKFGISLGDLEAIRDAACP